MVCVGRLVGRSTRLWREEAGDDTITVVKVFRRLLNRKKFIATIEEAVARRRRLERLRADGRAVRNLLEPIGWGGARLNSVDPRARKVPWFRMIKRIKCSNWFQGCLSLKKKM